MLLTVAQRHRGRIASGSAHDAATWVVRHKNFVDQGDQSVYWYKARAQVNQPGCAPLPQR